MAKRILIVEDDESIAEIEKDYLEMNGFETVHCADGREALRTAKRAMDAPPGEGFDLLLLDVMLPGMNGFEICKEIRAISEIPILMVTARQAEIDLVHGLGLGADDYITKPFSPGELVARVKSHLARYERRGGAAGGGDQPDREYRWQHLKVRPAQRLVTAEEKEVSLTAKEFDILMLFLENRGRVFTKEEVFERIWHEEAFGDLSTVTVHVRKIREKLERNPAAPALIETVWGVGYRGSVK